MLNSAPLWKSLVIEKMALTWFAILECWYAFAIMMNSIKKGQISWIKAKSPRCGSSKWSAAQVRTMCGTSQYVNVLAGSCCRWWMASPNVWLWFFSLVPRVGQLWYNRTRDGLRYYYGDLRGCLSHVTWRHSVASKDMLRYCCGNQILCFGIGVHLKWVYEN